MALLFRHLRYDISANVRSLSEQLFGFTMHYNGHRESAYVMANRRIAVRAFAELNLYNGSSNNLAAAFKESNVA